MNKVINGRLYDTATAAEIYTYDNGLPEKDYYALHETLYRKNSGEFFLYARGGFATEQDKPEIEFNETWEKLIPFSEEQAKKWCEQHVSGDEYMAVFGKVEE